MKTSRLTKLTKLTSFASLPLPRYISTDIGKGISKLARQNRYKFTSGYRTGDKPRINPSKTFFYLNSVFSPALRMEEFQAYRLEDDTIINALVARLPHERFLAGWTMGEGMASELHYKVFEGKEEALFAAREEARICCEQMEEALYLEEQEEEEEA
jgi:hypothetical protein